MRPDHVILPDISRDDRGSSGRARLRSGGRCAVLLAGIVSLLPSSPRAQGAEPGTIVVTPDAGVICNPAPCPQGVQVRTADTRAQTPAPVAQPNSSPGRAQPPVPASPVPTVPAPAPVPSPVPAAASPPVASPGRATAPIPAPPAPGSRPAAGSAPPKASSPGSSPEPAAPTTAPVAARPPAAAPPAAAPPAGTEPAAPAPAVAAPRPPQPAGAVPPPAPVVRAPARAPGIQVREWLREVVDSHPAVVSAQQRLGAAVAEVDFARWQFYPTPSVGFEAAARDVAAGSNQQTGFVRLQQPIYTGGRLTQQLSRASANSRASAFALDEERRTIALRLLQALGDARAAAVKRQAYRESAASHVEFLGLVQRRVNEGLSPRGDVVLARSRLSSVRADLEAAEVQMDQALSRLEQLLGRSLEASEYAALRADLVDDAAADWLIPALDRLVQLALQSSPSVSRSLAELEVRRADIGMARASFVPQVYLRAEHSRGNAGASQSQLYLGIGSSFGAGLSDRSTVSAAEQRLQSQQAEVEARRREVIEQVRSEHTLTLSGERRVGVLADSANYAATVVQAWQRQFLAGRKTWQELMNAAREKAQADALLGEASAARWVSAHRLRLLVEGVDDFLGLTIRAPEKAPGNS